MSKILIVDDDPRIVRMLERYLVGEGFDVAAAIDGASARSVFAEDGADLILLDLQLPDADGLDLAREFRAQSDVGIIILTGKGDPIDRVVGLEVGADDYVAKPFHMREVLARIKSLLRRVRAKAGAADGDGASGADGEFIEFKGFRLDLFRQELSRPDGTAVELTTGEFKLLEAFVSHPRRVLSRDQLLDITAGREWSPYDRSIDTQVRRLRQKLGGDAGAKDLIKTVRGAGYLFTAQVDRCDG